MKQNKFIPVIAAVLAALVVAAVANAQSVGLGIKKDSTLAGTGSSGSPLGLAPCSTSGHAWVWNGTAFACASASAGAGDITGVTVTSPACSAGSFMTALTGGATSGDAPVGGTCTAETGDISAVTVTDPACAAGSFVATLTGGASSGAAGVGGTCVAEVGDISGITAGNGLTGDTSSGAASLAVGCGTGITCAADAISADTSVVQSRVTGTCTSPNAIRVIDSAGAVTCTTGVLDTSNVSGTSGRSARFSGTNTVGNGAWTDDGTNATANGNTNLSAGISTLGQIKGTSQATTATGTQNDFVVNASTTLLRWSGTVTGVSFTGFKCGAADCSSADDTRLLYVICNGTAGGNVCGLNQDAAGSVAANRIYGLDGSHNVIIAGTNNAGQGAALLQYDGSALRWRVISVWSNRNDQNVSWINSVSFLGGVSISSPGITMSGNTNISIASGGVGHVLVKQTSITPSSCGTSPTGFATDIAGRITTGTGATGCVITWGTTWSNTPGCVVTFESGATGSYTTSTTALTITAGAAVTFAYSCAGTS